MADAGLPHPLTALCAGLAGVGNETERLAVENALAAEGVAGRVRIVTDGEIALEGRAGGRGGGADDRGHRLRRLRARGGRAGGAVRRVGDVRGRRGERVLHRPLRHRRALRAADGRGPATTLLAELMAEMGVDTASGIPPWVGRAAKGDIAALSRHVTAAADAGDGVALEVLRREAGELALHPRALARVLGPWTAPVSVVYHGGVLSSPLYARLVTEALAEGRTSSACARPWRTRWRVRWRWRWALPRRPDRRHPLPQTAVGEGATPCADACNLPLPQAVLGGGGCVAERRWGRGPTHHPPHP
jgi:hypothetical protein